MREKRRMTTTRRLRLTGLVAWTILPAAGCRTAVKMPDPFTVGIVYCEVARGRTNPGAVSPDVGDDLAVLRDLGFNTVFVPADGPTPNSLLRAAADRHGMVLRVERTGEARASDGLGRIDILQSAGQGDESVGQWLRGFHGALAGGGTDGVVFDGLRLVGDSTISAKRASAVKAVIRRAHLWGPRLRGTTIRPVPLDPLEYGPVTAVFFIGPKRRYLMLWNTSRQEFFRRRLTIETHGLGMTPRRFVTVPIDERAVVGDIYTVRRNRVSLRTRLAPGDAHLYEIF